MSRVCHMLILKKSNFFFLQKNRENVKKQGNMAHTQK